MNIKFKKWDCKLNFHEYTNHRTALVLTNAVDMKEDDMVWPVGTQQIAVASVNLPDVPLDSDEIAIKDYGENEGLLECLIDNKVVTEPIRFIQQGYVSIPICKLLINKEDAGI